MKTVSLEYGMVINVTVDLGVKNLDLIFFRMIQNLLKRTPVHDQEIPHQIFLLGGSALIKQNQDHRGNPDR
jgi:hypothetical protein